MNERIAQIARDTRELGICPGDTVLVHSSLKSLGKGVPPEDVIRGLGMAVGESGTLMFPALSYSSCNREHPYFDYHRSPSNVGAIPEYFRTEVDGVVRSMNPTHSCCALGRYAEELTKDHWQDHTPCGANSPYRRLYELSGKILFIGSGRGAILPCMPWRNWFVRRICFLIWCTILRWIGVETRVRQRASPTIFMGWNSAMTGCFRCCRRVLRLRARSDRRMPCGWMPVRYGTRRCNGIGRIRGILWIGGSRRNDTRAWSHRKRLLENGYYHQ